MKTAFEIRMDFTRACNQASELEELAEKINRIGKNSMEDAKSEVQNAWTGNNSNLFVQKVDAVAQQLISYASSLKTTASTIRRVARRIYEAEMAALALIDS